MNELNRQKLKKVISKIEGGNFDENDVDRLIFGIRDYSYGNKIVRELGNFLAHSDVRDKGDVNLALELFYLRVRLLFEYNREKLDVTKPFPEWVYRLFVLQIERFDDLLRKRFGISAGQLLKEIKRYTIKKSDSKISMAYGMRNRYIDAFEHVISIIDGRAIYNQTKIIEGIIEVCEKNKILDRKNIIVDQGNKIMLSVLLLFHRTKFNFKGFEDGICEISNVRRLPPERPQVVSAFQPHVSKLGQFGFLGVKGTIGLDAGKPVGLPFVTAIVETELLVDEWCEPEMFEDVDPGNFPSTAKDLTDMRSLNTNQPLMISTNFKLAPLASN